MSSYLEKLGVTVLIVGPPGLAGAQQFKTERQVPFAVLSDTGNAAHRAFGFKRRLLVLKDSGVVLIDRQGIVRYIRRNKDPRQSMSEVELLNYVDQLEG